MWECWSIPHDSKCYILTWKWFQVIIQDFTCQTTDLDLKKPKMLQNLDEQQFEMLDWQHYESTEIQKLKLKLKKTRTGCKSKFVNIQQIW